MSASVQSQILAAVVATLNAGGGLTAYRTRMTAFAKAQLPAINVLPDEGDAIYLDSDSINRKFRFKLRHMAIAVDEVDAAVDSQYVAAQKKLFADPTLGGLTYYCHELAQKWELEKGEFDTVALVVTYEVEFSTTRSDPSVAFE